MYSIQCLVLLSAIFLASSASVDLKGSVTVAPQPVFHATNRTRVPSVHYIIDAVETLKQAYAVYTEDNERATVWAKLFQEKYPQSEWNVVIGYTASYITSKYYVETSVDGAASSDKKEKDKPTKAKFFLIYSTQDIKNVSCF